MIKQDPIHLLEGYEATIQRLKRENEESSQQREQEKSALQRTINLLQQENYNLQVNSSNVKGTFPTLETIVISYSHFGHQIMLGFICQFEDSFEVTSSLYAYLEALVSDVRSLVDKQYSHVFNFLFPEPLSQLGNSRDLAKQLHEHLQSNYKLIMKLDEWCEQHESKKLVERFVAPTVCSYDLSDKSSEITQIVKDMHDVFWQIKLSNKLEFGEIGGFKPTHYHNSFSVQEPKVILPCLLVGETIVAKGFAF